MMNTGQEYRCSKSLASKKAIITGASRGIGAAIALEMAAEGADVILNYNNSKNEVEKLVQKIQSMGVRALAIRADVSVEAEVEGMFEKALEEFKDIDILVNNAGIRRDGLLMNMNQEDWNTVLSTNLNGAFLCTKHVLKNMIKNHSGSIISIASNSGATGVMGQTNYSASKAGIIAMTKCLALEIGRFGIRVNALAPGLIETDMTADIDEARKKEMIKQIALRRIGKPIEVARTAVFLSSDASSFITGQTLFVNGGDLL